MYKYDLRPVRDYHREATPAGRPAGEPSVAPIMQVGHNVIKNVARNAPVRLRRLREIPLPISADKDDTRY